MRTILFATSATLAISCPGAALAQTTSSGTTARPADPTIDEIVVTARRREERLQDVPISVNVTTGASLEQTVTRRLDEVAAYVPNLTVQRAIATPTFFIRGIGSTVTNLAVEPAVGLFVDGIYNGRNRQGLAAFLDLQRIEVLRGPQSALFGKNTSAGVINIISNDPGERSEFSAKVTGTFEGDNGLDGTLIASGPLNDKVGIRVALRYAKNDGWLYNDTTGRTEPRRRDLMGRLTAVVKPSDSVSIRLKSEAFDQAIDGDYLAQYVRGTPLGFRRQTTPGIRDDDNSKGSNSSVTIDVGLPGGQTISSITGYSRFSYEKNVDGDGGVAANLATVFGEDFDQISQEVRVTSPSEGRLQYVVGLFATRSESDFLSQSTTTAGTTNGTQRRVGNQVTKPVSLYAQATYRFIDQLRLTLSGRQTWETKIGSTTRTITGVLPPTNTAGSLAGERKESFFDPSAQLQFFVTPDAMLYVSYARGSKGGGFVFGDRAGTPATFEFDAERATAYEAGAKLTLFDRRATLNLTAYSTTYDNLQVTTYIGLTSTTVTRNAASARSRGFEVEATARPLPWLSFSVSGAYLDGTYTDYPNAPCRFGVTAPPGTVCQQDLSGERLPRASKFSGSGTVAAEVPVGDFRVKASSTVYGRSNFFTDDSFDPLGRQDGFAKIDARMGFARADDGWEIALIGKNLTNRATQTLSYTAPFVVNRLTFAPDPGRILAVQGSIRF